MTLSAVTPTLCGNLCIINPVLYEVKGDSLQIMKCLGVLTICRSFVLNTKAPRNEGQILLVEKAGVSPADYMHQIIL